MADTISKLNQAHVDQAVRELALKNPDWVIQSLYGHEYKHRSEDCAECRKPKPMETEQKP